VLLDPAIPGVDVTHGQPEDQGTPARLGEQSLVGPLPDPAPLGLTHRPFQPEQEAIIQLAGVVDALAIDDERVGKAAEIEELVPVAIVAGEPRDIETDDGPGVPETDLGHQPLEARPSRGRGSRLPEVVVDHDHLAPAQAAHVVLQIVLTTPALVVVPDLCQR